MPRTKSWIAHQKLSRVLGQQGSTYFPHEQLTDLLVGDVLYFQVLGQSIVVLGSADVVKEYLDKRAANTSDRVQTPMIELYVFCVAYIAFL